MLGKLAANAWPLYGQEDLPHFGMTCRNGHSGISDSGSTWCALTQHGLASDEQAFYHSDVDLPFADFFNVWGFGLWNRHL